MSHDPGSTTARGLAIEARVAAWLEARGFSIEDRNVECGGVELDIVAREPGGTRRVFFEVRSRSSDERGHPLETINAAKRRRLVRGATAWLVERSLWEKVEVRFDVIAVLASDPHGPLQIEHVRDAYWA